MTAKKSKKQVKQQGAVAPAPDQQRPRRHSADIPPSSPTNEKTLKDVSQEGSRLETLKALRDGLSGAFPQANARDKAPLARELRECMDQIETIENQNPTKFEEKPFYVIQTQAAERSARAKNKARA